MDTPPVFVRRKIWEKQLSLADITLPEQTIATLSRKYDAAPRQIEKSAKLAKGEQEASRIVKIIETALPASALLLEGSRDAIYDYSTVSEDFSRDLIASPDKNIQDKVDALIAAGNKDVPYSAIVKGVKGTGVKNLMRYIAEESRDNILDVSMQSLMVETPFTTAAGNIANAFNQAANSKKMLVIHDIEAIIEDDRRGRTWENSDLVDLFIGCAKNHDRPLVITTHKTDGDLPEALTYLFVNKLDLGPLSNEQKLSAFKHFFGEDAPEGLEKMGGLVVADFANVKKLLKRYAQAPDLKDVSSLLRQQVTFRNKVSAGRKIGFDKKP